MWNTLAASRIYKSETRRWTSGVVSFKSHSRSTQKPDPSGFKMDLWTSGKKTFKEPSWLQEIIMTRQIKCHQAKNPKRSNKKVYTVLVVWKCQLPWIQHISIKDILSSYLYNICIIIPSEQTVLIHSCKLSSVRLWQTLPCCTSCWLVSTSSARFNIQRNFISNMCSCGSVLRRSISSEVLGLKKKRLKRPGLKVISMYFCYFKLEMGESEQEDMNPERQRDVRVERRGCEVSVRRACCVCVKYLSHQQCEFSQTPRFNSKQTQLFFFFFIRLLWN